MSAEDADLVDYEEDDQLEVAKDDAKDAKK